MPLQKKSNGTRRPKERIKVLVQPTPVDRDNRKVHGDIKSSFHLKKARDLSRQSLDCTYTSPLPIDKFMAYDCTTKQFFLQDPALVPFNGVSPEAFTPSGGTPLPLGITVPNAKYYFFDIDTTAQVLDLTLLPALVGVLPGSIFRFRLIAGANQITFNDGVVNYNFVNIVGEFMNLVFDGTTYHVI